MHATVAELCRHLDVHVELLDELVGATQRQLQALLGYRTDGSADAAGELGAINGRIGELTAAVGHHAERVREGVLTVADAFHLELEEPHRVSVLAEALPPVEADALRERASCVRSLAEALSELARVNHVHARRGLQLVNAWWTLLSRGDDPTPTYNARGMTRIRKPVNTGTLTLNI